MVLQWNARKAEKIRMPGIRQRRSSRRALELPIRVFGTDFQGRDFVEDSTTLVVSQHGAKIRLTHKLVLDEEIQILCQGNNREAPFRVVSKAGEPTGEFSFWGVECLKPGENVLEGGPPRAGPKLGAGLRPRLDPKLSSKGKSSVQVVARCPKCGMRELMDLDEPQIRAIRELKGLVRDCPACGATGLWKRAAVQGS
jgi:hypothetical protein